MVTILFYYKYQVLTRVMTGGLGGVFPVDGKSGMDLASIAVLCSVTQRVKTRMLAKSSLIKIRTRDQTSTTLMTPLSTTTIVM